MFDILKKALSSITDVKIQKGYGVSCNDSVIINEDQATRIIPPLSPTSCKYVLRDDVGLFEFDGMVRLKNGVNSYKIRHVATGEQIVITSNLFSLLFKRID